MQTLTAFKINPLRLHQHHDHPEHVYPLAYLCLGYVDKFLEQPKLEAKGWCPWFGVERVGAW